DLVEARGEGDDAVARDRAVGRAQADDPAERGRLFDRAARVGAERPRGEAGGDRRGRATGRAAGDPGEIPGVPGRAERGVLGRRAHRELVHVRLAKKREARLLAALGDGLVEDGPVAGENLRPGGRLDSSG